MKNTLTYLPIGSLNYKSTIKKEIDYINQEALLRKDIWKQFVDVFRTHPDGADGWWRGEFFGKMMRGACLCYQYENNDELYEVLKEAVKDLLTTQDEYGRFSTYPIEKEFFGWDMWGRKYVMTSLLHFYTICKDESLKNQIVEALLKHARYIIKHVGNGKDQIKISDTSEWWEAINSSSILEPFVELYKVTNEKDILDFAKYIIDEGGIKNGNLIDIVKEGKLLPYQYPEAKAYETMSFFEGVLDYATVTDDKELFEVAIKFFEDVYESDITITGNAGCNEELFNNASVTQIYKPERVHQETCVAVTWMRVLTKLHLLTGSAKYYDRFEITARNAFAGSINYYHQSARDWFGKKDCSALPFDSYSPLKNSRRGISSGGFLYFPNGMHYGCCACIGSAGIGLTAINTVLLRDNILVINDYYTSEINYNKAHIVIDETLLENGKASLEIKVKEDITIQLRVPTWSSNSNIIIDGKKTEDCEDGYFTIDLAKGAHKINFDFSLDIKVEKIENQYAYVRGPLVLAVEEESNPDLVLEDLRYSDIEQIRFENAYGDEYLVKCVATTKDEQIIVFKDYSNSAKRWDIPKNRLTVWIDE